MTNTSEIQTMRDTLKWAIAIMITLLVILISGAVRAEVKQAETARQVQKINEDYLPYFAFQYIVESNQRLIDILTVLPTTTKDDPRYVEVMRKWNELQQNVTNQAGLNKRSGDGTRSSKEAF